MVLQALPYTLIRSLAILSRLLLPNQDPNLFNPAFPDDCIAALSTINTNSFISAKCDILNQFSLDNSSMISSFNNLNGYCSTGGGCSLAFEQWWSGSTEADGISLTNGIAGKHFFSILLI